ncbi:hypothetical protein ENSA5_60530 [Enhygromyxa salina]|uniref:Uncharacterized protein n=1 Tax=Enhygromyxa salina TaxID=215803 RepID=A0A2S9XDN3_9BACT|nr:hypothetical protein [Enhygromyxa salina]PRP90978.1 hypothetical protein ENSA5_60530 [Enhygromyxa salina]
MTGHEQPDTTATLQPTVTLRYRLQDADEWLVRDVDFEELFGGAAEHPEDLFHDVDWVPQHAAVSLLDDIGTADVAVTELTFEGSGGEKLTVKETFWNHGHSRIIEVMQQLDAQSEPYWEVIVDLRREAGETYELLRLGREHGAVVPLHHAVTHARPDGSKQDLTLFPSR